MEETISSYDIEIGDTVMLNSTGPAMTVESVDGKDVRCIWFNIVKGSLVSYTFKIQTLTKGERPFGNPEEPQESTEAREG